jgi:predicted nucleic acid-binding protein
MGRRKKDPELQIHVEPPKRKAKTLEARENQLIKMAYDLVEQRIANNTATSQETVEFLRRGSTKARLEKRILKKQEKLLAAKTEAITAAKRDEEAYNRAMEAMKSYGAFDID